MTKFLVTILFAVLVTASAIYMLQPVEAASPTEPAMDPTATRRAEPEPAWPAPAAPFDETPITPFETVGAKAYEP